MSWRSASLTACSAALLLAGCGGDTKRETAPTIEPAAAADLAGLSDEVADLIDSGDVCGAARKADELKAHADAAISDGRVPPPLAAQLRTNAEALVDGVNCPAPPPPPAADEDEDEDDGDEDKGKRKHGKEKKKGKKGKGRPPPLSPPLPELPLPPPPGKPPPPLPEGLQ